MLPAAENEMLERVARSERSYDILAAVREGREAGYDGRIAYVLPPDERGEAAREKASDLGLDAAYVAGKDPTEIAAARESDFVILPARIINDVNREDFDLIFAPD